MSPHFRLSEFLNSPTALKKCIANFFPQDRFDLFFGRARVISDILEDVRSLIDHPITITSGYRCLRLNQEVGGARSSRHLFMCAVDITFPNFEYNYMRVINLLRSRNCRFLKVDYARKYIHVDWTEAFLDRMSESLPFTL